MKSNIIGKFNFMLIILEKLKNEFSLELRWRTSEKIDFVFQNAYVSYVITMWFKSKGMWDICLEYSCSQFSMVRKEFPLRHCTFHINFTEKYSSTFKVVIRFHNKKTTWLLFPIDLKTFVMKSIMLLFRYQNLPKLSEFIFLNNYCFLHLLWKY